MFDHVKYLNKAMGFLFSSRITADGHYHRDDMLLGHGLDNVASIRVVTGLALVSALLVLVTFMLEATAGMGLLFIIIMQALYLYVVTLPRVGMGPGSAVLNSTLLARRSYRSYLQGRILFTPLRLSLSWRARTPETVAADRIRAASAQAAAAAASAAAAGGAVCGGAAGAESGGAGAVAGSDGLESDLLKARQENNLMGYLSHKGHKSGRMIMNTPVTVEDYIIAQSVLAADRAPGSASEQAGHSIINSGHIRSLSVPLLCDQIMYAGKLMTMEAIAQVLAVRAQMLSIEAGACGRETARAVQQARERAGGSLSEGAAVSAAIRELSSGLADGQAGGGAGGRAPCAAVGAAASGLAGGRLPAVKARAQVLPSDLCLYGFGFEWLPRHTRALMHIMEAGNNPSPFGSNGSPDIHAVACDEGYEPIVVPVRDLAGHTLLLGTTGSGKTRFFDLLVSQAIMRGDTVIVLDPKGDRDLQMSLIKAARAAGREPLENMVCLDLGRPAAPALNSSQGRAFASASMGAAAVPQAQDTVYLSARNLNVAPMTAFELAANSRVRKGLSSLISAEHYDAAGLERCGRASARLIAAWRDELAAIEQAQGGSAGDSDGAAVAGGCAAPGCVAAAAAIGAGRVLLDGSDLMPDSEWTSNQAILGALHNAHPELHDNTIYDDSLDDRLFDQINTGINPTASFERASEIGSRLKTLIDGPDSVFKDYSIMAVSAAVECCRLLGEKVTLASIRRYVCQHRNYEMALRQIINLTVIAINNPACSIYYNRIHGISDRRLATSRFAVSALMGDSFKTVSQNQVEKALVRLSEIGEIPARDGRAAAQRLAVLENDQEDEDGLRQDVEESYSDNQAAQDLDGQDRAGAYVRCGSEGWDDVDEDVADSAARVQRRRARAASEAAAGGDGPAGASASFDFTTAMGSRLNVSSEGAPSAVDLEEMERQIEADTMLAQARADVAALKSKNKNARASAARPASLLSLKEFYEWLMNNGYVRTDSSISQIFQTCLTNSLYFDKTTSSIRPSITGLTSGDLLPLLSSERPQASFSSIVRNNMIFYAGLHCLKDAQTGRNLGKILLSDLASVAGQIIASNVSDQRRISVFIDEASELANESLLQLLNKSRSAGFNITIATQSTADLSARMGSRDIAQQFIDNCNNVISLRVMNRDTASVVTSGLPATSRTHINTSVSSSQVGSGTASSISRGMMQEECEKFPPSMLSLLPNFEFVARFANGHFYKGFIPIIDRRRTAGTRPDLSTLDQWQAHAAAKSAAASAAPAGPAPVVPPAQPADPQGPLTGAAASAMNGQAVAAQAASAPAPVKEAHSAAAAAPGLPQSDGDGFLVAAPPLWDGPDASMLADVPASEQPGGPASEQPGGCCALHGAQGADSAARPSVAASAGPAGELPEVDSPFSYESGIRPPSLAIEPVIRVDSTRNLNTVKLRDEDFLTMRVSAPYARSSAAGAEDGADRAAQASSGHSCDHPERPGSNERVLISPAPLTTAALNATVPAMDRDYIAASPFSVNSRAAASAVAAADSGATGAAGRGAASVGHDKGAGYGKAGHSGSLIMRPLLWAVSMVKTAAVSAVYGLVALVLSQMLLRMYALAAEAVLILTVVLVPAVLMDSTALSVLADSALELLRGVKAYVLLAGHVLSSGPEQLGALLYEHTSFTDRCRAVWEIFTSSWQLPLTMAVTGMLWGHHVGLTSEIHHRSLMGLRYFTRVRSPLNVVLLALALVMLWKGWLMCIEYSLLILWLQFFIQAFALSCFFSRHSR